MKGSVRVKGVNHVENTACILKYSVIIPHYNSVVLLKRLLGSIPDRDDIQVLVVDDVSDLECFNSIVCTATNVSISRLDEKGFAGGARNFGLSMALGKYVIFADCDDIFSEEAFAIFDGAAQSNYDLVLFKTSSFLEGSDRIGSRDDYRNNRLLSRPRVAALGAVGPVAKLVSRSLVEEHGLYFSSVIAANDVAFSIKLACVATRIKVVQKVVYLISEGRHTLSSDVSLDKALSRLQEQRKRITLVRKYRPVSMFKYCLSHSRYISFIRDSERLSSFVYDEEFKKYLNDLGWMIVVVLKFQNFLYSNIVVLISGNRVESPGECCECSRTTCQSSNNRRNFIVAVRSSDFNLARQSLRIPIVVDVRVLTDDIPVFNRSLACVNKVPRNGRLESNSPYMMSTTKANSLLSLDDHSHYFLKLALMLALAAVPPCRGNLKENFLIKNGFFFCESLHSSSVAFVVKATFMGGAFAVSSDGIHNKFPEGHTISENLGADAQLSRLKEQRKRIALIKHYKPVNIFLYCLQFSRLKHFIRVGSKLDSLEFDRELEQYKRDLGIVVCSLRKFTGIIVFFSNIFSR